MRIVASISKRPNIYRFLKNSKLKLDESCVICYVSCVMCHVSCVMCHVSHVTCHVQRVMCHMSYVTCLVSPVTCHLSPFTCHHNTQIVKARDLKFWEKVHLPHLWHVLCHMSQVTCHMLLTFTLFSFLFLFYKEVKLIGGRSVINGAYHV